MSLGGTARPRSISLDRLVLLPRRSPGERSGPPQLPFDHDRRVRRAVDEPPIRFAVEGSSQSRARCAYFAQKVSNIFSL